MHSLELRNEPQHSVAATVCTGYSATIQKLRQIKYEEPLQELRELSAGPEDCSDPPDAELLERIAVYRQRENPTMGCELHIS